MQIDRVLFPIESLGPGKRITVWTVGCSKHCNNCSNKELWQLNDKKNILVDELLCFLISIIQKEDVDGITFTGGDPFEQKDELLYLVKHLRSYCKDILVYTGYTWKELSQRLTISEIAEVKENIGVIIDGSYIDELNNSFCSLIGSTNQNIIFNDEALRTTYKTYIEQGRKIQNVYVGERVISVGIHSKEEKNG